MGKNLIIKPLVISGLIVAYLFNNTAMAKSKSPDGPPRIHVDASVIPDAVPKTEPKSRYGNPKTYKVFGKRYHVMQTAEGYKQRGKASWYGTKFHNRRTSSGEPYNMFAMTAAHKNLPLPTYAKVRNLDNNNEIIVKINDRGPFHEDRIIDLSYAAARKLGIYEQGTGHVEVEALNPFEAKILNNQAEAYLQFGAYHEREEAEKIMAELQFHTDKPLRIKHTALPNRTLFHVQLGPFSNRNYLNEMTAKLLLAGFNFSRGQTV